MLTKTLLQKLCSPFSSLTIAFGFWLLWKAKGLFQLLSANILVFRAWAARSAEFLSILVYPLVGHWGKWGGRRGGSAEQTVAMLAHRAVKFHTPWQLTCLTLVPALLWTTRRCFSSSKEQKGQWHLEKVPDRSCYYRLISKPVGTVVTYPSYVAPKSPPPPGNHSRVIREKGWILLAKSTSAQESLFYFFFCLQS